ncbi:hypothetical protein MINTM001_23560 [Mycobacterium paraintracellulare]|uniref:hypothetical protein n=1 Tax=Mycobacterium paraintracellulare TaxID=1138383 RepID=UPI0019296F6D|nr:hypothetical protein [Mycobacterium paraintracellulare]BCO41217.1 hypothetical protein MINTM001_23560 [Mycobacterium paraintracellulare]
MTASEETVDKLQRRIPEPSDGDRRRTVISYGTPAHRASQHPQSRRVYSQSELCDRRRRQLPVTLEGGWSLSTEVAAICAPLAEGVAAATSPAGHWRAVDQLTDAVHGAISVAVALLARADAERRCRHLGVDDRGRSVQALVDLAERPKLPEITDDDLAAGTWAATLTALADAYSADLSGLLGRARTTTVSDRMLAALREVDLAALALQRRVDRDIAAKSRIAKPAVATDADRKRAELHELGVL